MEKLKHEGALIPPHVKIITDKTPAKRRTKKVKTRKYTFRRPIKFTFKRRKPRSYSSIGIVGNEDTEYLDKHQFDPNYENFMRLMEEQEWRESENLTKTNSKTRSHNK